VSRLEGKVGIIMGGASPNMGGTVAHLMAQEGAKVFINDIDAEIVKGTVEFLKSRGFEAAGAVGDASDEEQVADVVEKAVAAFGTIDLLYNNAGWHYFAQILDTELEPWNDQFRRNMTAAMLTTKHVGRVMADHGRGGSIVHTASDAGHQGEAGSPGYSGVKAGLINFARAAAMDLAQHGVRVNTVSPTFNEHLLLRDQIRSGHRRPGPFSWTSDHFLRGIPLGRFCSVNDIANAVVFLLSDEASFVTAQDIRLDGGALARYWPWQPGEHTGVSTEKFLSNYHPIRYGERSEDVFSP
jgi:NAD(P)-dependent dehydrogenase (short-subunit alcohol dehydrogenase family)